MHLSILTIVICRFPLRNKNLLAKWLAAVRRKNWQPTASSVLCSDHFTPDCFRYYTLNRHLREDAVPTIFEFPEHMQSAAKAFKQTIEINKVIDISKDMMSSNSVKKKTQQPHVNPLNRIKIEHSYHLPGSPGQLRKFMDIKLQKECKKTKMLSDRCRAADKRLKTSHRKVVQLKAKVKEMKNKIDIDKEAVLLIEKKFDQNSAGFDIIKNCLEGRPNAYNDATKSFATTLHFYSAKAYDFVRDTFNKCLPHPSTLRRWTSAIDGKPGFTAESFQVFSTVIFVLTLSISEIHLLVNIRQNIS